MGGTYLAPSNPIGKDMRKPPNLPRLGALLDPMGRQGMNLDVWGSS